MKLKQDKDGTPHSSKLGRFRSSIADQRIHPRFANLDSFDIRHFFFCCRVPPQININFGHTDTILPVYTAFRLFKDSQNLVADNFDINKNRKFRASSIDPFSANFGVALYKCDSEYVVKLFVNEELIINPACNNTICTYKEFNTFYSDLANCNFDEICENYTNNGVQIIPDYIQWFMLVLFYSLS